MARSNNFQVRVTGDTTKFDAAMSKAERELRDFGQAARSAFALVGITSFTAAFASAAKTIADFERANSELAAVLGTNLKGISDLTQSAKELGRTSEFTASEVTQLQIALSRLGFDSTQIKQMQGSVLNFALAMNTDLASAADFTGASLRAFGLEAKDTGYLLDVMSASTTNSALDFSKLQTSISVVAPIAKAFGLDVKETAAFLGVLANNGFDASSAATALRNILLNLSNSNGKLATGIGHSAKSFDEIIAAFKELSEQGIEVDKVLAMTDNRSAAAATTIITQAEAVQTLKEKLDEADGSLDKMAETMNDNLLGATKGLSSAWEGLILSFENSNGPMKDVVNGLTSILNRMTDIMNGADVKWYEALLGPVFGTWIYNRNKKGTSLDGGAGYAGGGMGGGSRPEGGPAGPASPTTPTPPTPLTPAELKALQKAKEQTEKEIQQMLTYLDKRLENNERLSVLNDLPKVNDIQAFTGMGGLATIADDFKQRLTAELGDITVYVGIEADTQKVFDVTNEINSLIESSVIRSSELIGDLLGTLAGGGAAWGDFKSAALAAFGDLAIAVGKIAISAGMASEGIKAALHLDNPYIAIAAGAALIALGTAVKSGLSSVANGDYGSAGGGYASGYSSGSAGGDYEMRDIQVNVTGTLQADGNQLLAVINNTQKKNYYTQ